ncbi:DUF1810 domain-containing protein [Pseudoroseomonas ludipueritiae]|uniref:DUF1810 domain-containing protein n=1 Tax=Pseudoroseomonas ludipueritiae TaxID=198093 RepID=A0ABR7RD73_9PROT|nr:DUF1810 domain-containing protein [Pseudoroseomonas ludipueritiae]
MLDLLANPDTYDLDRFVRAQDPMMAAVRRELRQGQKRSHWMWFVFPQVAGLGQSDMARRYAIGSLEEARAYLNHAVLGPRLLECTALANDVQGRSAYELFGSPDDMKFQSSMTLFALARPGERVFRRALDRFYAGTPDHATLIALCGG